MLAVTDITHSVLPPTCPSLCSQDNHLTALHEACLWLPAALRVKRTVFNSPARNCPIWSSPTSLARCHNPLPVSPASPPRLCAHCSPPHREGRSPLHLHFLSFRDHPPSLPHRHNSCPSFISWFKSHFLRDAICGSSHMAHFLWEVFICLWASVVHVHDPH